MAVVPQVRLATLTDLALVARDCYISPAIVQRKIAEGEVFVAELAGALVGYVRLEHL